MIAVRVGSGSRVMVAAAAVLALPFAALAGPSPADKCEAGKNKTVGSYYSCLAKAEAKAITKAATPDYSKCTAKFNDKWDGAETKGDGECRDVVLTAPMNSYVAAQAAEAASVVAGAPIPDCAGDLVACEDDLTTCDGDLATCEAQPVGQVHETGQTICYDAAGSVIACTDTGQDGELQKGIADSFTDNGDGTITDNRTGLMWEKLSDNGDIHDKDDTYTWDNAFASKVATLNSGTFAGYADWRVPNTKELQSLVSFGAVGPSTHSAFHSDCVAACTVTTCSCTQSNNYWSSSTYQNDPPGAWYVSFNVGLTSFAHKSTSRGVRAVRAGS
ncbi:MAG: DUF1566 domain-containing protein [Candidatus Binatia bacterium]